MECEECKRYAEEIDQAQRKRDWEEVNRLQMKLDEHMLVQHSYGEDANTPGYDWGN